MDTVALHGWVCIHITDGADDPPFSYTVGLFRTYSHPELIVFGLPQEQANTLLSQAVEFIQQGRSLDSDAARIWFSGLPCSLLQVSVELYPHYVGMCREYYQGDRFPLLQLFWHAHSPDGGYSRASRQPVLGHPVP